MTTFGLAFSSQFESSLLTAITFSDNFSLYMFFSCMAHWLHCVLTQLSPGFIFVNIGYVFLGYVYIPDVMSNVGIEIGNAYLA